MTSRLPNKQKAIRIHETGGYDVIKCDTIGVPEVGDDQLLVKNTYAGLNYMEFYFRTGIIPVNFPFTLGNEGSGEVVKVGANVANYKLGDKVGYMTKQTMQEYCVFTESCPIVKLPATISDKEMASGLLQGLTAQSLVERAYQVQKGDVVFVHAAAGGCGALVVQLAKHHGALVIGSTSSEAKAAVAKKAGCDFVLNYKSENVVQRVEEITEGRLCHVVFDAVGKTTWEVSKACARSEGTIVSYGASCGEEPTLTPMELHKKSLALKRFGLWSVMEDWNRITTALVDKMTSGLLQFDVSEIYPLSDAARAMEKLETGKTTGKVLIQF